MSNPTDLSSAAPVVVSDPAAEPPRAGRRWSRAATIWLLIGVSLLPGVVAAADREWWAGLPGAARLAAYTVSGVLIVLLCLLILRPEHPDGGTPG
ncbi:MAG TPA: hypothetical protein VHR43_01410 [Gemmatimonadales bacterium]|nr:hypothetical protein [Gemmatimonadales bacterium]